MRLVDPFFEAVERGDVQVVTSALTLTEVLSHPIQHGNTELVERYSDVLLNTGSFTTLPVSAEIATEAASLRAAYGLKTPDAIQLATALQSGATAFVTNDRDFDSVVALEIVALSTLIA